MATSFDELLKRSSRRTKSRNRQDYVLTVEGDDPIRIQYPDALKSMEYERASTVWDQVRILAGSEFPRLIDLFRGQDISVVQLMLTDMWEFWEDDSMQVPGGKEV